MKNDEWEKVTWEVLSNVQTGRMSLADAQEKLDNLRIGWEGYVVVDPQSNNYKCSPIFFSVKEAEKWRRDFRESALKVVTVDVILKN